MTADETKTLYMFDIDTEGSTVEDRITTFGFKQYGEAGKHVIYYLDEGETVSQSDISASSTVDLRPVDSEEELLEEVYHFIDENDINNPNATSIVGFDKNNRNFDKIPHIRTRNSRCHINSNIHWILKDVKRLKIDKAIQSEFNTTTMDPMHGLSNLNKGKLVKLYELALSSAGEDPNDATIGTVSELKADLKEYESHIDADMMNKLIEEFKDLEKDDFSREVKDLSSLYDVLINRNNHVEHYTVVDDPFEDPKESIDCFNNGNLTDVVQHNVSNLERCDAMVSKIIRMVAQGEKSKLPTINSVRGANK